MKPILKRTAQFILDAVLVLAFVFCGALLLHAIERVAK